MNTFASKFILSTDLWTKSVLVSPFFWVSELPGSIFCVIKISAALPMHGWDFRASQRGEKKKKNPPEIVLDKCNKSIEMMESTSGLHSCKSMPGKVSWNK